MISEFIELGPFTKAAEKLLGLDGLRVLQAELMANPDTGALIPGGRGLRKVRIALPGRGKSGGARVIYFFHTPAGTCFLLALYAKTEAGNLTKAEVNQLARLIEAIKNQ
jgi:hypothetical protein